MLTFYFNGMEGSMPEEEVLTSGMVGQEVKFLFDTSWRGAYKTAVFVAGAVCRTVEIADNTDLAPILTIPEEVLAHPCQRLYAGIWSRNEAGDYVRPTIMVKGPMIQFGADPTIE